MNSNLLTLMLRTFTTCHYAAPLFTVVNNPSLYSHTMNSLRETFAPDRACLSLVCDNVDNPY
jgi:hypothetical protein